MHSMSSNNNPHQTVSRKDMPASRMEALVSCLSRTSGYIALALGIIGAVALVGMVF